MAEGSRWVQPEEWPDGLQGCEGCRHLLVLLLFGWRVRSPWELPRRWERVWRRARRRRVHWLSKMWNSGAVPWHPKRHRPLSASDNRQAWAEADMPDRYPSDSIPEYRLNEFFPDPKEQEELDRRALHRLHSDMDPATVARMVSEVSYVLKHLEPRPTDELADHFTASFEKPWPPRLEDVHEVLVEWWGRYDAHPIPEQRKNNRKGVALRVATVLPLWGWFDTEEGWVDTDAEPEPTGFVFEEFDLTYDQLRPMLDRA